MLVGHVHELADDLGHVGDRRQPVGVERLRQHRAARRVEQPLLAERVPERLHDPALDLAASPERVHDPADVVDRGDPLDAHLAGLDVHRHLGDLDAEREHSHSRRVRAPRAPAEDLHVAEQSRQLLERPGAAVGMDDRAAREREGVLLDAEALRRDLAELAAGVGRRRAHRRAHRGQGRGAGRDRGERPARRVAELDPNALERQPELLGGDLRHRRARAGADVLHRRDDDRARRRSRARSHAYEGGPPPPYQIWLASPTPRLHGPSRAGAHLVAARPVRARRAS